jgi:hypothetical protein
MIVEYDEDGLMKSDPKRAPDAAHHASDAQLIRGPKELIGSRVCGAARARCTASENLRRR